MYEIVKDGKTIKQYPFEQQCIVWLLLKGRISAGYGWWFLDKRYAIRKRGKNER